MEATTNPPHDVGIVLLELLLGLKLGIPVVALVYATLQDQFDEVAATAGHTGGGWYIQLIDRRYMTWAGASTILDLVTGGHITHLPGPARESIVYDLAEIIRARKAGKDVAGAEGGVETDGMRDDLD